MALDGRELYFTCDGAGDLTVVLEAGFDGDSTAWRRVQPEVAKFTRVCAYDRLGRGRSGPATPAAMNHSGTMVATLRALLTAAEIPGPYVLVGHSFGGLNVWLFAARHPEQVAGLVLVDSAHPAIYARLPSAVIQDTDLHASAAAVKDSDPLPDVPLIVLTHTRDTNIGRELGFAEAEWLDWQAELARLTPRATQRLVPDSGHHIALDQPQAVIDAIGEVLDAARRKNDGAV